MDHIPAGSLRKDSAWEEAPIATRTLSPASPQSALGSLHPQPESADARVEPDLQTAVASMAPERMTSHRVAGPTTPERPHSPRLGSLLTSSSRDKADQPEQGHARGPSGIQAPAHKFPRKREEQKSPLTLATRPRPRPSTSLPSGLDRSALAMLRKRTATGQRTASKETRSLPFGVAKYEDATPVVGSATPAGIQAQLPAHTSGLSQPGFLNSWLGLGRGTRGASSRASSWEATEADNPRANGAGSTTVAQDIVKAAPFLCRSMSPALSARHAMEGLARQATLSGRPAQRTVTLGLGLGCDHPINSMPRLDETCGKSGKCNTP